MRPTQSPLCDLDRVNNRIRELGTLGAIPGGGVTRLALTDHDRRARNLLVKWMKALNLDVKIDGIGNIFGIRWGTKRTAALVIGSHLDSVTEGGLYDGTLGVLGGLEAIEVLNQLKIGSDLTVVVANFTNEEGVRYVPDMMGSLVASGGMALEEVWKITEIQNREATIKSELSSIGYLGDFELRQLEPSRFLELHIEQGPILEEEGLDIGVVEGVQGIFWTEFIWSGQANHAGTTPIQARKDAGLAGASLNVFCNQQAIRSRGSLVATVGANEVYPGVPNIIPGRCRVTMDLRSQQSDVLKLSQSELEHYARKYASEKGLGLNIRELVRFEPVRFDADLAQKVEEAAARLELSAKRMYSGAGHDAQMMQAMCPSIMVFIPSRGGVSHSPHEFSRPEQIGAGIDVLVNVVLELLVN